MMLTFTSGQSVGAQSCAVLFTIDDSLIEDVETFNISLAASPSDESTVRFTIGEDVTTVTILQDPNDSKTRLKAIAIIYIVCLK